MGADEDRTHERLKALRRELADPKIKEHRGRIVKTTGDRLLIEFASVVDAVRCVAPDRRIEFRIGINLGDIIKDGRDIYGDGVNVAPGSKPWPNPAGSASAGSYAIRYATSWPFHSRTWASSRSRTSYGLCACTVSCFRSALLRKRRGRRLFCASTSHPKC